MSEFASAWTEEEIEAAKETKRLLRANNEFDQAFLSDREIFVSCVNCKFRPDKTVEKMMKWTKEMKDSFSIKSFDEVYGDLGRDGNGSEAAWEKMSSLFTAYAGCGLDKQNRSIMWIKSRRTTKEEERDSIRAGVLYWLTMHADMVSLRNGITFVIDTTDNSMVDKVGNEGKLQRVYQSIPLRPKNIFITGAGWIKRAFINALITLASLFTKDKVIERIKFVTMDQVREEVEESSMPAYLGGGGGGLETNEQVVQYVRDRLSNFPPIPDSLD